MTLNQSVNISSNRKPALIFPKNEVDVWFGVTLAIIYISAMLFALLIYILCRDKKLRSGSGALILNYILTEFVLLTIIYPINIIAGYPGFDAHLNCSVYRIFLHVPRTAACYQAVSLALNRSVAIFFPHRYKNFAKKKIIIIMIAGSWLLGFVIGFVPFFDYGGIYSNDGVGSGNCAVTKVYNRLLYNVHTALMLNVPIAITGILYFVVLTQILIRKLCCMVNVVSANEANHRLSRRRMWSVITLFASFVWYCVCYFPPPIINAYFRSAWLNTQTSLWSHTLAPLGYAANPDYRRKLREMLGAVLAKRTKNSSVSPTVQT